jgi:putative transposase
VKDLQAKYGASQTQACAVMMISRSVYHYRARRRDQTPLVNRIKEIAAARVRYGYQRVHIVLRREGWLVNRKRVYRLYRLEGLSLFQRRPRRHRSAMQRSRPPGAQAMNESWSMDFVSDQLYDGRKLRALTLIDAYTRECLAIWVDQGIRGEHVVTVVDTVSSERGAPRRIQVDNGPEFVSKVLDRWAYEHHVELAFSRPGKPTDNAYIEAFNGRLRQECLNQHWFLSLHDARRKIEAWRQGHNESRPHGALGWATPAEFARRCLQTGTRLRPHKSEDSASEQF